MDLSGVALRTDASCVGSGAGNSGAPGSLPERRVAIGGFPESLSCTHDKCGSSSAPAVRAVAPRRRRQPCASATAGTSNLVQCSSIENTVSVFWRINRHHHAGDRSHYSAAPGDLQSRSIHGKGATRGFGDMHEATGVVQAGRRNRYGGGWSVAAFRNRCAPRPGRVLEARQRRLRGRRPARDRVASASPAPPSRAGGRSCTCTTERARWFAHILLVGYAESTASFG